MIGREKFKIYNKKISKRLKDHKVLILSHRGSARANIIENTIPAFKAALLEGSDMLEVDVIRSKDGVYYTFHDGMEKRLLNENKNIKTMTSKKIDSLYYINGIGHKTNYKVERLGDVLKAFDKNVFFNIDRTWDEWPEFLRELDKYSMHDQIVLKCPVKQKYLKLLENHETKYMFIPIIRSLKDIDLVLRYENINTIGMELIARSEDDPLFQDELIRSIKEENLLVFVNAITLDDANILFAKFDDNKSIIESPESGWGKLLTKNPDIIQTDWPSLLSMYRKEWLKKV